MPEGHPTHRHAEFVIPQGEFQQRTRRDHRQFGHFFREPPQLGKDFAGGLDLIEQQYAALGMDFPSQNQGKVVDDFAWVIGRKVFVKYSPEQRVVLCYFMQTRPDPVIPHRIAPGFAFVVCIHLYALTPLNGSTVRNCRSRSQSPSHRKPAT